MSLLIAGVLTAGQTPLAQLPEQPVIQSETAIQQSNQGQLSQALPSADITPPEFIQPNEGIETASLELKNKYQNILNKSREKIQLTSSSIVSDAGDIQPATEIAQQDNQLSQVTSVSQLEDVQPSNWAFAALQSLVERYGCIAGYPDGVYRGTRAISRYEFAAGLNTCLERINELIANNKTNAIGNEDLIQLQRLQAEFRSELQQLPQRVETLETQTSELEAHQFSATTRLYGQAVFNIQGTNSPDVDLFPRDGVPERKGETNLTFTNSVQLTLATSFTGRDLLLTGLSAGNLGSTAPLVFTNMGRLGYESDTENNVVINELSYRFPVGNNLGIVVGTAGVNPVNTFRGINPLEGSGDGAISLFGQRNPILTIGNSTGGIGFDWQISDRISLQGVYSTEIPSFAGDSQSGGLFGGRLTTGAQLTLAPTNNIDVGVHYLYSHSPDDLLGNGIGDSQLISPFAPTSAFNTQAIGATAAWRINPNVQLGGWGGWTHSKPVDLSGSVETLNWMVFAAFPNLLRPGNLGGVMVGQPPKITSSTLPDESNFPNFSDGGTPGGRRDTSVHVELFYRTQITDNLALTPGVFVIFNPDHNANNQPLVVGAMRATFRF
ncbi:iron uptake porin [Calothrix sp. PCC 7507]|uniref:iron uptake porin n=1 Tax=Calothrix sp. PCC 7507 TaxID=99598 RepID=UPI00029F2BDC|nr:iron uptake porin [Calothrix sp. PCC 7507]AFY33459.1 Carbohydrate-selective porin OprB [Calothrix sp. PCC 7507]